MTRDQMIAVLLSRMSGAPNYDDYAEWLDQQTDETIRSLYT